jgi:N-acetylneuraminate synthase
MPSFYIGDRLVGGESDPLVIAEIGINHSGSIDVAIEMARAAISSGAEIIKHQTHIPADEMSSEAKSVRPGNSDKPIYQIIEECSLSEEEEFELKKFVEGQGAMFISTPFSRAAVTRIAKMNLPAVKIGSGECNNYPLVKLIAQLGKPIILSTGMNTIQSIAKSVQIIRSHNLPFALMHCTNLYPTPANHIRLGAIKDLETAFPEAVLGLSDHSTSNYPAIAAVALGAQIIERHFTDSMSRPGPDISCSMDPDSLKELIFATKIVKSASGGHKNRIEAEQVTENFAFASVVSIKSIKEGEFLTYENVWVKRPSGGDFTAEAFESVLGRKAARDIPSDVQLSKDDLAH